MVKQTNYVTASEVGDYVFCKRGWWLKFNGIETGNQEIMNTGIAKHQKLAVNVQNIDRLKRIARITITIGLVLLLIALLLFYVAP